MPSIISGPLCRPGYVSQPEPPRPYLDHESGEGPLALETMDIVREPSGNRLKNKCKDMVKNESTKRRETLSRGEIAGGVGYEEAIDRSSQSSSRDMQKGASTANMKKSAPLEDDIGKDFFNSWGSSKLGNDTVDFNVETLPKTKRVPLILMKCNDNFELSGSFENLPSFNLDVPDLDFSGLSKKKEKINECSSKEFVAAKKDTKEDKFSFDFDFNCFDIGSKSVEKRPANRSVNIASHHSSECNPDRSTDRISKDSITKGTDPLIVKPRTTIENGDSMQTISTLPSRSASPADSNNSGCLTQYSRKELENGSLIGSTQTRKDIFMPSVSKKPMQGLKNVEEKHDSEQNLIQSPLRCRSEPKTSSSVSAKKTSALLYQTSAIAKNEAEPGIQKPNTNSIIAPKISSADNNAVSVKADYAKEKVLSICRLGLHAINRNNTAGAGLNGSNPCGNFISAIPIAIQGNTSNLNSAMPRDKLCSLDKKMECLTNVASKKVESANTDTLLYLHTPLKRKIDEELIADLDASSPSKCVKESITHKRNLFEPSSNTKLKTVSLIKSTETSQEVAIDANLTSLTAVREKEHLVSEVPSCSEDEKNLQKAQNLTKELDSICCTLRKKHAEAKELQVRSIINNASLLLLNYPLQEEKISFDLCNG
ncbi:hypothetical protein HPP92_007965 [Vanilla planifolia]|uniref:Uncharacterized protein n=1 Tax=Vanilla planifolia TaxID=51239 RepID=A0A835RDK7_VANPL|nr:hypothetical protein HPP92_007965 [Vanilla planifolia]